MEPSDLTEGMVHVDGVDRIRRRAAAFAVALLAVLLSAAPARAERSSAGSLAFQVETAAAGVQFAAVQTPPNFGPIVSGLVDATSGYAAGLFQTGGDSDGQAAAFFPGNLVAQGPDLFCAEVVQPNSPPFPACPGPVATANYPLLAEANYPTRPAAHAAPAGTPASGPAPLAATPAAANATASATGDTGTSVADGLFALTGSGSAVSIGSETASETTTTDATAAHATVASVLSDVTIAGLVRIRSIRSVDVVTVPATGQPNDHPTVTVAGVTVAGQPATIDQSGIHVMGRDGPSLARALVSQHVTIREIGITRSDTTGFARSTASGLEVDFTVPADDQRIPPPPQLPGAIQSICAMTGFPCGIPNPAATYVGSMTLGAVGVAASTEPGLDFSLSFPLPALTATTTSGAGSAGTANAAGPAGSLGSEPARTVGTAAPQIAAAPRSGFAAVFDLLGRDALDRFYLVLAIGSSVLFLGWRAAMARATRSGR
ncbi:MAG TPA: hypothetical protein VNG13_10240 [Mycobacteriales bacterium]|nr:hypothetical protein [Mycobacteriales bacterium]